MPLNVRFGEFLLDTDRRQLLRAGAPRPLTPRAFKLLELLVERRPKAVSKAEIHDRLWPRTFVSEGNIARLMFEVREALGDDAGEPRYLRTLRGFGYAFAGASRAPEAFSEHTTSGVAHRLFWGELRATLQQGDNVLGRGPEATVWVEAPSVSRRHAVIQVDGASATLADAGSKNGTKVGGRDGRTPQPLRDGDEIRLGSERIVYRLVSTTVTTRTSTGRRR
ncbi:MAG TPA: FHA domain-containing protein [Candidatus Thermoplasmatota archaeon]